MGKLSQDSAFLYCFPPLASKKDRKEILEAGPSRRGK